MPNVTKINVLNACAALKRKDPAAFEKFLSDLHVKNWTEIQEKDFENCVATCQLKLGEIDNNAENAVVELSMRDSFDKTALAINKKSEPDAGINDDIATVINGGATLAEGFNNAAKMLHARNANRAAAAAK